MHFTWSSRANIQNIQVANTERESESEKAWAYMQLQNKSGWTLGCIFGNPQVSMNAKTV